EETRAELRTAFGNILAFRIAQGRPDQDVTCPDPGGCMFCGLAAVSMPATRVVALYGDHAVAAVVWSERTTISSSLGGRVVRDRLDGYLCPVCDKAVQDAGSFGMAAMGQFLARHLEATGRESEAKNIAAAARRDELEGVVGHAVFGGRGTCTPWEHVSLGV